MKFNQKIDKKIPLIKAIKGSTFKKEVKGNVITFTLPNMSLSFDNFRAICTAFWAFKNKPITLDLTSFMKIIRTENPMLTVAAFLIKVDSFNEYCFTLKSNAKKFESNILIDKKISSYINDVKKIVNGIHLARDFQIMPGNYLGIKDYAEQVKKILDSLKNKDLKVSIMDINEIKREKMELLQAVNKGGNEPAKMVIIEYKGNKSSKEKLAYVGKGIMYDAGGYELKSNHGMDEMNQDMIGSASVFATLYALAATKQKTNVIGFMPLAKNLINENSMVVNDVYHACNGRSVEIMSPDSEGRLILADAVAYANKKYNPTKIFTIATLCGLSQLAYGDYITPCWTSSLETANEVIYAGATCLDYIITLPFFKDYEYEVNHSSKIADCANNFIQRHEASNAIAATFIKLFSKCPDFTHFDVCGTSLFKKHAINPLVLTLYTIANNYFCKK